jgi:hypothetical protein
MSHHIFSKWLTTILESFCLHLQEQNEFLHQLLDYQTDLFLYTSCFHLSVYPIQRVAATELLAATGRDEMRVLISFVSLRGLKQPTEWMSAHGMKLIKPDRAEN